MSAQPAEACSTAAGSRHCMVRAPQDWARGSVSWFPSTSRGVILEKESKPHGHVHRAAGERKSSHRRSSRKAITLAKRWHHGLEKISGLSRSRSTSGGSDPSRQSNVPSRHCPPAPGTHVPEQQSPPSKPHT